MRHVSNILLYLDTYVVLPHEAVAVALMTWEAGSHSIRLLNKMLFFCIVPSLFFPTFPKPMQRLSWPGSDVCLRALASTKSMSTSPKRETRGWSVGQTWNIGLRWAAVSYFKSSRWTSETLAVFLFIDVKKDANPVVVRSFCKHLHNVRGQHQNWGLIAIDCCWLSKRCCFDWIVTPCSLVIYAASRLLSPYRFCIFHEHLNSDVDVIMLWRIEKCDYDEESSLLVRTEPRIYHRTAPIFPDRFWSSELVRSEF